MKKIVMVIMCMVILASNPLFAATKAELQEQWNALVEEEESTKEQIETKKQEQTQVLKEMSQYDTVALAFAEIVKSRPFVVKQQRVFSSYSEYYLVKNPILDNEFNAMYAVFGNAYFGEHIRLGYSENININGLFVAAEVLGDVPEAYKQLKARKKEIEKEIETLESRKDKIEEDKERVATNYQNAGKEPSNWAKEEVEQAMAKGLIPNELKNDYQEYITRQEFCKLVVELLTEHYNMEIDAMLKQDGIDYPSTSPFSDTADKEVIITSLYGIMGGIGDGKFNPDGYISREMAATILTRLIHKQGITVNNKATHNFTDIDQASNWAKDSIQYISGCLGRGRFIMSGANGEFNPKNYYTREQAYISMYRLSGFLENKDILKVGNPQPQLLIYLGKDYVAKNNTHDVSACLYYKNGKYYLELQGTKSGTAYVCLSSRSEAVTVEGNTLKGKYQDSLGNEGEVMIQYLSDDKAKLNITVSKKNHKTTMQIENKEATLDGYSELVSQTQLLDDDDSNDDPCKE